MTLNWSSFDDVAILNVCDIFLLLNFGLLKAEKPEPLTLALQNGG
jgi:hypothetical protein